jgi:hypothetical protein
MNQENIAFIDKQLTYHGFNQHVRDKVKVELSNNSKPVMEIDAIMKQTNHATKQVEEVKYTLNLAVKNDKVYFNNYTATLADRELKVHIGSGKNITAKESFNLLQDRSVFRPDIQTKEGEKFSAWVKVDFMQKQDNGQPKMLFFNQNYGYDLKAALTKFSIKEMQDPKAEANLLKSLESGNLQAITLVGKSGNEQKIFIEAQPQFKNINLYNQDGQKLYIPTEASVKNENKPTGLNSEIPPSAKLEQPVSKERTKLKM